MKKFFPLLFILALIPALFTSCDDDGYYYNDYDSYLPGQWQLISADGIRVTGYNVNYLDFYSNGAGTYYYYQNTIPYKMALRWSVDLYAGGSVLYITYADGSQVSMDYWYNSNYTRLYTSWYEGAYRHEYVYQLIDDFSWGAPAKAPATQGAADIFTTRPGGALKPAQ
ncbi:MAG: hypothetical protein HDS66_08685 [Bacteroidales bacterium]|nr:hypothetical protein [Bacteroidales bacterium]